MYCTMSLLYVKVLFSALCAVVLAHNKQPNIVLILADDLGWNDVGFHGSNQIPTPNIDALAYNGVVLNRFYVQSTCTPSRSALLTGQYPIRYGFQVMPILHGENRYLPLHLKTLPLHLKQLGYATRLVGKWHLGHSYFNNTPIYRGFDSHFGYWPGAIDYFNHVADGGYGMRRNLLTSWSTQNEYATHLFTRKSQDAIIEHNYKKPLFLMISHLAVHAADENQLLEVPDFAETNKTFGYISDHRRRLFAGMLTELDKSVGSVCNTLKDKGVLDDTIIIFLSDNGAQNTEMGYDNAGSNWPLRGMKATLFEGGVRSPAIMYYSKAKVKSAINSQLMHITDLMPTLYVAAGGNVKDLGTIDGVSQWGAITQGDESSRSSVLLDIDDFHPHSSLIGYRGRYKLINDSVINEFGQDGYYGKDTSPTKNPPYDVDLVLASPTNKAINKRLTKKKILTIRKKLTIQCTHKGTRPKPCDKNGLCLFDLVNDPCETENVAKKYPHIITDLSKQLLSYWKILKPQDKHFTDTKSNPIYYNNTWSTWMEHQ
ncbi:hypothetical protein RI129_012956 [Pyrocoelia pectoralis]|uniref:Sulfatase N-terminal domain-containing protein n=1 Tax=Pyrocoelia pectoralis TaxID=417401 RepID=A0AAN7ZFH8_9COLE